jgi:predicted nucleic acid-binding protein
MKQALDFSSDNESNVSSSDEDGSDKKYRKIAEVNITYDPVTELSNGSVQFVLKERNDLLDKK